MSLVRSQEDEVRCYSIQLNNIMKCEFCNKEHDGSFGTGRFCSKSCRSKSAAQKVTKHKCNFKRKTKEGGWKCVHCSEVFETRAKLYKHVREVHPDFTLAGGKKAWNQGLTKETSDLVKKTGETYKARLEAGEIKVWCAGQTLPEVMKEKISKGMLKAHAEGRAHNIGASRWNNEPSWPEQWFMKVIENEFDDKNYIREYPFGRYSLDFAWESKKKCIEIDGEQHQRFEDYKKRDERKDKFLKENGWEVLRIIWKEAYANPKEIIQKAKCFIENQN